VQQAKAIGTLKGYAFITERQQITQELGSKKVFNMHRLVHMMQREELAMCQRVLGAEHPHTLTSMAQLASMYGIQGRWKEA
jgi:hypothetical protein